MARIITQLLAPQGELHAVSCDHGCSGSKCEGGRVPAVENSNEHGYFVPSHNTDEDDWHNASIERLMRDNRAAGL